MTAQTLADLTENVLYKKFLRTYHLQENEMSRSNQLYKEWRKQQTPETKPTTSPEPKRREFLENLTRLAPDWERRRRMVNLRLKTLLRIYLSKWFYLGLEWQEIELTMNLLERFPELDSDLIRTPENLNKIGFDLITLRINLDQKQSVYNKGVYLEDFGNLIDYLLSEEDLNAVWKLRSVQSLRDFIFQPFSDHEHEGRKGIRKPRIRGYRDGKASPRDPKLTALSRKVDQLFWTQVHEERWEALWNDLEQQTINLIPKRNHE